MVPFVDFWKIQPGKPGLGEISLKNKQCTGKCIFAWLNYNTIIYGG